MFPKFKWREKGGLRVRQTYHGTQEDSDSDTISNRKLFALAGWPTSFLQQQSLAGEALPNFHCERKSFGFEKFLQSIIVKAITAVACAVRH
jgi:hypothetical protein